MKVEKKYIKNPIFQIFLVLLMTSCGSGGGGSNSGNLRGDSKPIKTSYENTRTVESKEKNKILKTTELPQGLVYENINVPQGDSSGQNLVLGILDSDFIQNKDKLKQKYKNLKVLEKK